MKLNDLNWIGLEMFAAYRHGSLVHMIQTGLCTNEPRAASIEELELAELKD